MEGGVELARSGARVGAVVEGGGVTTGRCTYTVLQKDT